MVINKNLKPLGLLRPSDTALALTWKEWAEATVTEFESREWERRRFWDEWKATEEAKFEAKRKDWASRTFECGCHASRTVEELHGELVKCEKQLIEIANITSYYYDD